MNELQSLLTSEKLEAFHAGLMKDAYLYFGAYAVEEGTRFVLWVPDVSTVAVACTDPDGLEEAIFQMEQHPLDPTIWQIQIPQKMIGYSYEYIIETPEGKTLRKSDPYAQASEMRPATKSVIAPVSKHSWSKSVLQQKKFKTKTIGKNPWPFMSYISGPGNEIYRVVF